MIEDDILKLLAIKKKLYYKDLMYEFDLNLQYSFILINRLIKNEKVNVSHEIIEDKGRKWMRKYIVLR